MAERLTLARPYARAAFEVADGEGSLQVWMKALNRLAEFVATPQLQGVLTSPTLSGARKITLLTELLGESVTPTFANFIAVLAENKRLPLVPEIRDLFQVMKAQKENSVEVSLTTAFPVKDDVLSTLGAVLSRKFGREVKLKSTVDESLLGGAVIRAGDTVIDGSVKGRLGKLARAMTA